MVGGRFKEEDLGWWEGKAGNSWRTDVWALRGGGDAGHTILVTKKYLLFMPLKTGCISSCHLYGTLTHYTPLLFKEAPAGSMPKPRRCNSGTGLQEAGGAAGVPLQGSQPAEGGLHPRLLEGERLPLLPAPGVPGGRHPGHPGHPHPGGAPQVSAALPPQIPGTPH